MTDLETQIQLATSEPDSEELGLIPLEVNLLILEKLEQDLLYPTFIGTVARISTGAGWFLIILVIAVSGSEDFTRRILSNILSRGIGRVQYLVARSLSLWFAAGVGIFIIVMLAAATGPLLHKQVTGDPISLDGLGGALLQVIRTWLTYLPFIIVTLFWAVLARNAGPAMGVAIGLHTFELLNGFVIPFVAVVFGNVPGSEIPWIYRVQVRLLSVTLGYNADVFLNWDAPFSRDAIFVAKALGLSNASLLPSTPLKSAIILMIFTGLFMLWMMRILHRRDVSYGS
ncbi:MAG: hypothetical protein A2Z14_07565 [Chloroflexi bacterium RBG_16_48_8]|nr:MAG: hypothetical protein A2Z14_07565 [Chloroflexi bacterium RBG_16_48_8]